MKNISIATFLIIAAACSSANLKKANQLPEEKTILNVNTEGKGPSFSVEVTKGKSFYYPLMAIWLEDMDSNYIQTLYVPRSVATGVFRYGRQEGNHWISAPKRAPQTLPYWSHKRGVKSSDGLFMPDPENPVPDTYSGATPVNGFIVYAKADNKLPDKFRVLFEINQNWDWNEYWTNNKFPDDENYKMSCQPALVYEAIIDMNKVEDSYPMKVIGHSHYSGKTGELFRDLSTITTALHIAESVIVKVK